MVKIEAWQRQSSDPHPAVTPVRGDIIRSSPAADKQLTAACISTIGGAFAGDEYIQRVFGVKPGDESRLLEGMSRVYLDRFRDAQLLYHSRVRAIAGLLLCSDCVHQRTVLRTRQ
jgi:hypothetical protein